MLFRFQERGLANLLSDWFLNIIYDGVYFIYLKDLFIYLRDQDSAGWGAEEGERVLSRLCTELGA